MGKSLVLRLSNVRSRDLPCAAASAADTRRRARRLQRDVAILAKFVGVYCKHRHREAGKAPLRFGGRACPWTFDWPPLCGPCRKLLAHGVVKRLRCPYDPKPSCRKCPAHCYAPKYRAAMREVMRFSGRRLVLSGRLDYLLHLLT